MHDFFFSDECNTILSLLALLVALYSVWYTRRFNRPRISIEEFYIERSFDFPGIEFSILNISNTPIVLKSIAFSIGGKSVHPISNYEGAVESIKGPLGFHLESPVIDTEPEILEDETTMLPNSKEDFRYYFKSIDTPITITVETDRMLSIFSKKKSFIFRSNKRC